MSIAEDQSGRLWIGTYYGGLNKFEKQSESFTNYKNIPDDPNSIGSNTISWFFLDRSGTFWIGTYSGGLFSLEPNEDKFLHYNFSNDPKKIFPSNITSLYEDNSKILWFGTGGQGLFKFNRANGKTKIYTIEDGSPSNYIAGILEDNSGNLWLSSDKGLSKFNPTTEYFRHYDVEDGLQGNEFEESAYCKSLTGELIFGGKNGFNIFYPDSIKDNTHIPPVFITDFYLFNKPVQIGYDSLSDRIILSKSLIESEEIELNFDDKVFSFEFAALDFHAPNKNKYAYIMEGFDKDWTYIDANYRLVTYTNLDPGEYTFRVRGSNNDGIWNEAGTSIKIIILPPWWQTNWAYLIYILLIGSIIYFTWKAQLKRIRTKHEYEMSRFEAQKLHEVDELKSRFFTNISHEFRTPLTLILGPVKTMIEKLNEGKMKDDLGMVHRNANKLLELVNQLLDISKLESGNMKLQTIPLNMIPLLKALVLSFTSYAERKRITLKFNSFEDELIVYIDKDKIEKIITNILSNAFKFTPDGGRIEVNVSLPKPKTPPKEGTSTSSLSPPGRGTEEVGHKTETPIRFVEISISDTGVGIPKEKISKIFDRFYQVDGSHTREQEGTGIGLSLTKELVELHKGKIEVKSEEGKGTTFTVSIPLGKEHLDSEEIIEIEKKYEKEKAAAEYGEDFEKKNEHKVDIEFFGKESFPLLLIVEDNLDVRNYIKDNLKREYRILEAVDGEDGWNKSVESAEGGPDLIVSDVMMPRMDGFKFCEKLKTDERTSHIPLILLTAKAAKEDKLEGYETGADEYIMKPFEPDELRARIKNLIEQRKRLHEHFRRKGMFDTETSNITSIDKKFLQKIYDVITQHISDSSFGVEALADSIAVSRSVLHKKLVSLTGEPPVELIRRIRLNRAVELIEKKFGNLSEIALEVGFTNPAYFSDCFRKHFGVSPSQYERKNVKN
jgi:signal transduction histidine kinase/DNA-binding response OmpR family regulator